MKIRIIVTFVLAVCVGMNTTVTAKKKTVKKASSSKIKVVKPDTVSVKDFSYAMGMAQTKGLKTYLQTNIGIDTAKYMNEFIRGMKEMSEKLQDPAVKAHTIGMQLAMQVFGDFPGRIDQQIAGKDTTIMDRDLYKKGFLDVLQNSALPYSVDSAGKIVTKQMEFYAKEKLERDFGQNRKDGEKFLAENAKLKDVKTTPSGLQYKVLKQGTGAVPTAKSTVKVHYEGRLIDGTVFDTSEGKSPFQTNVSHVIKGWTEALTMMPVGSKWEIYVPQELAYGAREAGKIQPFSALIFKIELLEIVEPAKPAAEAKK